MYVSQFVCGIVFTILLELGIVILYGALHKEENDDETT